MSLVKHNALSKVKAVQQKAAPDKPLDKHYPHSSTKARCNNADQQPNLATVTQPSTPERYVCTNEVP